MEKWKGVALLLGAVALVSAAQGQSIMTVGRHGNRLIYAKRYPGDGISIPPEGAVYKLPLPSTFLYNPRDLRARRIPTSTGSRRSNEEVVEHTAHGSLTHPNSPTEDESHKQELLTPSNLPRSEGNTVPDHQTTLLNKHVASQATKNRHPTTSTQHIVKTSAIKQSVATFRQGRRRPGRPLPSLPSFQVRPNRPNPHLRPPPAGIHLLVGQPGPAILANDVDSERHTQFQSHVESSTTVPGDHARSLPNGLQNRRHPEENVQPSSRPHTVSQDKQRVHQIRVQQAVDPSSVIVENSEFSEGPFEKNTNDRPQQVHINTNDGPHQIHRKGNDGPHQIHRNSNVVSPQDHRNTNDRPNQVHRNTNGGLPQLYRNTNDESSQVHRNTNDGSSQVHRNTNDESTQVHGNTNDGSSQVHRNTNDRFSQVHRNINDGSTQVHRNTNDGPPPVVATRSSTFTTDRESSHDEFRIVNQRGADKSRSATPNTQVNERNTVFGPSPSSKQSVTGGAVDQETASSGAAFDIAIPPVPNKFVAPPFENGGWRPMLIDVGLVEEQQSGPAALLESTSERFEQGRQLDATPASDTRQGKSPPGLAPADVNEARRNVNRKNEFGIQSYDEAQRTYQFLAAKHQSHALKQPPAPATIHNDISATQVNPKQEDQESSRQTDSPKSPVPPATQDLTHNDFNETHVNPKQEDQELHKQTDSPKSPVPPVTQDLTHNDFSATQVNPKQEDRESSRQTDSPKPHVSPSTQDPIHNYFSATHMNSEHKNRQPHRKTDSPKSPATQGLKPTSSSMTHQQEDGSDGHPSAKPIQSDEFLTWFVGSEDSESESPNSPGHGNNHQATSYGSSHEGNTEERHSSKLEQPLPHIFVEGKIMSLQKLMDSMDFSDEVNYAQPSLRTNFAKLRGASISANDRKYQHSAVGQEDQKSIPFKVATMGKNEDNSVREGNLNRRYRRIGSEQQNDRDAQYKSSDTDLSAEGSRSGVNVSIPFISAEYLPAQYSFDEDIPSDAQETAPRIAIANIQPRANLKNRDQAVEKLVIGVKNYQRTTQSHLQENRSNQLTETVDYPSTTGRTQFDFYNIDDNISESGLPITDNERNQLDFFNIDDNISESGLPITDNERNQLDFYNIEDNTSEAGLPITGNENRPPAEQETSVDDETENTEGNESQSTITYNQGIGGADSDVKTGDRNESTSPLNTLAENSQLSTAGEHIEAANVLIPSFSVPASGAGCEVTQRPGTDAGSTARIGMSDWSDWRRRHPDSPLESVLKSGKTVVVRKRIRGIYMPDTPIQTQLHP